jgi:hypothetical protein
MTNIKLLENVKVVYWMETIQSKAEVDGEVIEFRYSENSKGSDFYVFNGSNWVEADTDQENAILSICSSLEINKDSKAGEEFEYDED